MSDKQTMRKFLVSLTKEVKVLVPVWARSRSDAVFRSEYNFDFLLETEMNRNSHGTAKKVKALDISRDRNFAKEPAYDFKTRERTSEQPKEANL